MKNPFRNLALLTVTVVSLSLNFYQCADSDKKDPASDVAKGYVTIKMGDSTATSCATVTTGEDASNMIKAYTASGDNSDFFVCRADLLKMLSDETCDGVFLKRGQDAAGNAVNLAWQAMTGDGTPGVFLVLGPRHCSCLPCCGSDSTLRTMTSTPHP